MSCAELRGQSLTSFPGNIQEVRVAASGRSRWSDFRCMERKDVGSGGGAGFASQAWVFREFGEPSEDLRDPNRGQGDSTTRTVQTLSNISTAKPNAFNTAVVSH